MSSRSRLPKRRAAIATSAVPQGPAVRDARTCGLTASLPAEQTFEFRARRIDGSAIGGLPRTGTWLEMITEVGALFVADLFGRGLATMFGELRCIVDAELADMQFGATLRTLIETPQRQRQRRERGTALPATEIVSHAQEASGSRVDPPETRAAPCPYANARGVARAAAAVPRPPTCRRLHRLPARDRAPSRLRQ